MTARKSKDLVSLERRVRDFTGQRPDVAYAKLAAPFATLQFSPRANGRYDAHVKFMGKRTEGVLSVYGHGSPKGHCGFAYGRRKGDVFQFVQILYGLDTRDEAIIKAGETLLEIRGEASQIIRWKHAEFQKLFWDAKKLRAELDKEGLERFADFFPVESDLFNEIGYDQVNDGYYIPYFVGGNYVAVEWVSLTQPVMYYHDRCRVYAKTQACYKGTFPCLSLTEKQRDNRLLVLTDHAESAAAIRMHDIDAFGLLHGNNRPSLEMMRGLEHRKIIIAGQNTPSGRRFRQCLQTYLRKRGFDAELFAFPDEEILPTGLTIFDALKHGGTIEITSKNSLDVEVPDRLYEFAKGQTQKRFERLRASYASVPALIALTPVTMLSANAKCVYNFLLIKQSRYDHAKIDNAEFQAAVGLAKEARSKAIRELINMGLIERIANCTYKVMKQEEFMKSPAAMQLFKAIEQREQTTRRQKRARQRPARKRKTETPVLQN